MSAGERKFTLLFMHQMKTGGVTLNRIIEAQYAQAKIFKIDGGRYRESTKAFSRLPEPERKTFDVISGHMFFGLHGFVRHPYTYITMLRHPIDRVISLYYYRLRPQHRYQIPPSMSLIEFLEGGGTMNANNGMTRFIAGKDIDNVPYGQCTDDMIEIAKKNLKQDFLVTGLTERFDESIILLKRLLNWKQMPYYRRKNVNQLKPPQVDFSDEALAVIKELNRLDLQLYEYAEKLLEELIDSQNSSFQSELKLFQEYNLK